MVEHDLVCRRPARRVGAEGERYGRNFIRQADKSQIPAMMSYWSASRCQANAEGDHVRLEMGA
jgi:hypothetical protein